VRAPLLDHHLLEFIGTLPAAWMPGKRVLKDAMRGLVPDNILTRAKAGFGVPLEHWFGGDFGAFSREILLDGVARQRGILNTDYIEKRMAQQKRPWMEQSGALWAILMFELWCRAYAS
jgi:asparagine synthase (glutamine-hydrolysing)